MFGKKKDEERILSAVDERRKISAGRIESREYKIFKEEEKIAGMAGTLYERMCNYAEKHLKVEPDKRTAERIKEAIDFAHLNITPAGSSSLTILLTAAAAIFIMIFMILGAVGLPGIDVGLGFIMMALLAPFAYFMYTYPIHLKKRFEIRTGSDIVTMILFMAIFMRNTPSMEGALRFAADNLTGSLAYELRKLIWDVEIGKYHSVDEALIEYSLKWSTNKAFVQAIQTMRDSLKQAEERRLSMLDQSVDLILAATSEKADEYGRKLRLPITVIHAMGIILPVMGLVLFPMLAVFLDVPPIALFIGYDVMLPIVLYFIIINTLEMRPATFSTIDITDHPDVPPRGSMSLGKKKKFLSVWPVALAIMAMIIGVGVFLFITSADDFIPSVVVIAGLAMGPTVYSLGVSQQSLKVRKEVRNIEEEFREALFQMGNQLSVGKPLEVGLEDTLSKIGDLSIKKFFRIAVDNIRNMGMTFREAFFDKTYGAVRYYPSNLIVTTMRTVIEAAEKGVKTASVAMLSISDFLTRTHNTQVKVEENMSEVVSSLQFQGLFLSPIMSGIIVTLAIIVIRILQQIGPQLQSAGSAAAFGFLSNLWANVPISPGIFQLIVGIYMIESSIILGYFVNGIQNGEDYIGRYDIIGTMIMFGTIVYIIALFITMTVFMPLIENII